MAIKTALQQGVGVINTHRTFYPHYAWVIVSIISVMQMVGASIRGAFGVFVDPMTEIFGWSQGTVTLAYGIMSLVTAVASPLAGSLGDRFGARRSMMVGTVLFVISMVLTGLITKPWHLYITLSLVLGIAQAIFLVPLIPAAMTWFRRHLGLGMGIVMAAWGIGPALSAPLMGFLIEETGWKGTFWITAAGGGVIMAVLVTFFRDRPADKGLLPYGSLPGDPAPSLRKVDPERASQFTKYMRGTKAFWNMSAIHFLGCVGHAIIVIYLIPIAVREGISLVAAAGLLAVLSAVSTISRLITPILAETLGPRTVMAGWYLLQGVTVVMLFWTHDLWLFYVFAVLFGLGYGGESGVFPELNRRYYGHAPMGPPYGFQMLGAGLGMALGGWMGGVIFDITGTYSIALFVSIAASLGGILCIMLLEPTSRLLIADWDRDATSKEPAKARAEPAMGD